MEEEREMLHQEIPKFLGEKEVVSGGLPTYSKENTVCRREYGERRCRCGGGEARGRGFNLGKDGQCMSGLTEGE